MDRFTLQVKYNGQIRPFSFDYSATLGEVEAVVANGCGIAMLPGSQTVLSLRSGEVISGLPSSLFLCLSSNLRLEIDNPTSNKSVTVTLTYAPPLGGPIATASAGGLSSIDEVLALAAQTGDVSFRSGDELLSSFDNLLGDMNKFLTESTAIAQSQAAATTATPTPTQTATPTPTQTATSAFLTEFDDLVQQQTVKKKKSMYSRDLNAFLEAEFAGIKRIGETKPAAEATPSTEPAASSQVQQPTQLQQQNPQSGPGTRVVPGLVIPTSGSPSLGNAPRSDNPHGSSDETLVLSVSQRADMARELAAAKKSGLEAQQVKVTAIGDKMDKKEKVKVKEKKEKKVKKKGGDERETIAADEFETVVNPTYVSTDRAGINPLFANTSGTTPQTGMEYGGFVSPLASATTTPRGNISQAPGSPHGTPGILSPRSGAGTPSPTTPRRTMNASPSSPRGQQTAASSSSSTTTSFSTGFSITPLSFTKSHPGGSGIALRRDHTVQGGVAIGTRQPVMFDQGDVSSTLAASSEALLSSNTPISSSNATSFPSSVSASSSVTSSLASTCTHVIMTSTPERILASPTSPASPAPTTTTTTTPVTTEAPATTTTIAQIQPEATPATTSSDTPAVTPTSTSGSDQQDLLTAQRALEEERARAERRNAERYAVLLAQQNTATAEEQTRILAEQQAKVNEEAETAAAVKKAQEVEAQAQRAREEAERKAQEEQQRLATQQAEQAAQQKAVKEQQRLLAEKQQAVAVQQQASVAPATPAATAASSMTPTSDPQVPTFVSHAPAQNYPDPTSISAMLHEQLDQLLMESPAAPATTSTSVATRAAPVASSSDTTTPSAAPSAGPPAPTKEEASIADDVDQLLAELDRPYIPGGASSSTTETKHAPDSVPDLREPNSKPAEPPPADHVSPSSTSTDSSTSSNAATAADGNPKSTVRHKKKKKKAPRELDENPTGTFSAVRKSERERKKKRQVQGAAAAAKCAANGTSDAPGTSGTTSSSFNGNKSTLSPSDVEPSSLVLEVPIKPRKRRIVESDSDSDSDDDYDGLLGASDRTKSTCSPSPFSPSSSFPAKSIITHTKSSSVLNSRSTIADGSPPHPITRSPSSGRSIVSNIKLDVRASGTSDSPGTKTPGSSVYSPNAPTTSSTTPNPAKKKFKRARKRNFDEEMEHRRRMNYAQSSDEDSEKGVLQTGYIFKQARPSSSFRYAEKDQLLWFHLSLHRMSMMRQAPFWLTEPQKLAMERNRYKLTNAACYPYSTPVEGSGSTATTLNVMFHLAEQTGMRALLQCDAEASIQELKARAYAKLESVVKSPTTASGSGFVNIVGTNALRIIDEYVVQLTDTPIFVLEEATTLKQLMVSASWMHVEQFTLVDRSVYELTKLKANKVTKMISLNSSDSSLDASSGPDQSPTPAERITTSFSGLFGTSNSNSTLSTPLYEPSDTEEMHFRKNVARNTVILVKKTIQTASVTTAPIPPYIQSRILTTIHYEPGSSSIIAAGPNSTVAELLEDAKKKFFVPQSTAMVLKICGRREYIIQQNLPLHRIEYVRKQLERKRKLQFQIIKASAIGCIVNEETKAVKLPWEAEAGSSPTQASSVQHRLSPRNFKSDSKARLQLGTVAREAANVRTQRSMPVSTVPKIINESDASQIETPKERAKRLRLAHRRVSLYYPTTMAFAVPSWLVKQAFEVKVCSAEALVFGEALKNLNVLNMSFFVEVGLFVGGEPIVKSETTSGLPWSDTLVWDQVLVFPSLCLGDIPKETRMCATLYGHDKSGDIPLGWVSTRLFDFHDVLASGPMTTCMWPEEAANPIGFCGSCTKTKDKNSHRLKLEFESYALPVTYTDLMTLPRAQESSHPIPNDRQRTDIEEIVEMDPLFYPNNRERETLWRFRHWIRDRHPTALTKLCLSVPWTDPLQVRDFYHLLESWPKLEPENVLELLDARYANERVREYAVVCLEAIPDSKLVAFMLQLVQVLKYEINHYTVLAQFLLDRALENEMVIGQRLFWYLKAELHVPEVRERFGLILEALLFLCSDQLRELLQQQITVISILQDCAFKVKTYPEARRTETIRKMLSEIKFPASFTLPLDPSLELSGNLDISKCRCFDSAKAPILLCFRSADPCIEKETDNLIIFKAGDDLRQDALTLQMLTLMDQMWKQTGLDLHMTPYQVAVTGDGTGLIEVVPDSMTTAKIQRENGGSLAAFSEKPLFNWLKANNPSENELFSAVDNFVLSCAGYCVATYVLGIGDRHNDNIMVDRKGHFFHIDFGHFLGNYKSWAGIWDREKAPFVFTPEFAFVMDGKDSDKFNYFVRQCQRAYNIVRQQGNFILNLFIMMLSTGIPELRSAADLLYLRDALASHLTDAEAGDFFIKLIDSSLSSTTTRLNAFFHLLAH